MVDVCYLRLEVFSSYHLQGNKEYVDIASPIKNVLQGVGVGRVRKSRRPESGPCGS